jgi:hypothetical protein
MPGKKAGSAIIVAFLVMILPLTLVLLLLSGPAGGFSPG